MFKYEYETVNCSMDGWGVFSGNVYTIEDYRSVIDAKAKEGWRYVGYVPTKQKGTGHVEELDLIFEKWIQE